MSFYLRKAVRVGPLRFNLSKSGIGTSVGVTGFRVGASPRGNYVHMGRGGLYYRKSLPSVSSPTRLPEAEQEAPPPPGDTHEGFVDIESSDVSSMTDSSSQDLVSELSAKRKRLWLWPICGVLGLLALGFMNRYEAPVYALYTAAALVVLATLAVAYRDILAKTTVLLYEVEDEFERAFQVLNDAFAEMRRCKKSWHMEASAHVKDRKRHAGASSLIQRSPNSLSVKNPPRIRTNVATPCIGVGHQKLYFFPDKVLIVEKKGVGAVSYENLVIEVSPSRFIEEDSVPGDAEIVDHTWKYVNKRGGPDKRFKDNREIPIALYEEVHFRSDTGLNEQIQLSKRGAAEPFCDAIRTMGHAAQTMTNAAEV